MQIYEEFWYFVSQSSVFFNLSPFFFSFSLRETFFYERAERLLLMEIREWREELRGVNECAEFVLEYILCKKILVYIKWFGG